MAETASVESTAAECPLCRRPVEPPGCGPCPDCGAALAGGWLEENAAGPLAIPPETIESGSARFQFIERLGGGGAGEVWRAWDAGASRPVAIKVLRLQSSDDPDRRSRELWRFQREIEAVSRLDHPGIVRLYQSGIAVDGRPWYAMEPVEGERLDRWAAGAEGGRPKRIQLFLDLCDAVAHAHQRGIVHRDLKPANVLVTADDRPRVLDFGLARRFDDAGIDFSLTLDGEVLGTPMFMAPEQFGGAGGAVDTRTDIYALGVILYHLLTGQWPYRAAPSIVEWIAEWNRSVPAPPRHHAPDLPRDLDAIVMKCLEREQGHRYSHVGELAADVRAWRDGVPVSARSLSPAERATRWLRRNWRPAAAAFVIAAVAVGFGIGAYFQEHAVAAERARHLLYAQSLVSNVMAELEMQARATGQTDVLTSAAQRIADFPWSDGGAGASFDLRRFRGLAALGRGDLLSARGTTGASLGSYREAAQHFEVLAKESPDRPIYRINASHAHLGIARNLADLDQFDSAIEHLFKATAPFVDGPRSLRSPLTADLWSSALALAGRDAWKSENTSALSRLARNAAEFERWIGAGGAGDAITGFDRHRWLARAAVAHAELNLARTAPASGARAAIAALPAARIALAEWRRDTPGEAEAIRLEARADLAGFRAHVAIGNNEAARSSFIAAATLLRSESSVLARQANRTREERALARWLQTSTDRGGLGAVDAVALADEARLALEAVRYDVTLRQPLAHLLVWQSGLQFSLDRERDALRSLRRAYSHFAAVAGVIPRPLEARLAAAEIALELYRASDRYPPANPARWLKALRDQLAAAGDFETATEDEFRRRTVLAEEVERLGIPLAAAE